MVLTKDIIGQASKIVYGRAGDSVKVIPQDVLTEMVLVESNGQRFWVFPEDIEKEKVHE